MSKAWVHAQSSAKRYGGKAEDYIEEIFGRFITNSDGKEVYVRDIAEQHVLEDLGFIPSLSDWLKEMPPQPWMAGQRKMAVKIVD